MKREDLKRSFDSVEPSHSAEQRMLDHILQKSEKPGGVRHIKFNLRKAMPVLTMTVLVSAGLIMWGLSSGNPLREKTNEGRMNAGDSIGSGVTEDNVAILKDQFQLDSRHYIVLTDEQKREFGLPDVIHDEDIGDKLASISTSVDESLMGLEVYEYMPAGGEAVVAVKKETGYQLFKFLSFESYMNNQDEDARAYLELYGIHSADDIASILFLGHSEQAKIEGRLDILAEITDRQKITDFYDYYSVIPNSSDSYFDKLFNYAGSDDGHGKAVPDPAEPNSGKNVVHPVPPDYGDGVSNDLPAEMQNGEAVPDPAKPESGKTVVSPDYGDALFYDMPADSDGGNVSHGASQSITGEIVEGAANHGRMPTSSQGSTGTRALENAITIRIYNKSGVYMEAPYYPNIGFISRHAVNDAFAEFLRDCLEW